MTSEELIVNAMTVDVEDYFQVSAFENVIPRESWKHQQIRVQDNTERVLALFSRCNVKATFFVLGWICERFPDLVRTIVDSGHELASHGFQHTRVTEQTPEQFRQDVIRTRKLLEDTAGSQVRGYRAASFSINADNLWALDELSEAGYQYSSSIYPIQHDLYGMPDAPRFAFHPRNNGLTEIPISTIRLAGRNFPCGGGGYFRLFPYALSRTALRSINNREAAPCVFYFHPWEVDVDQPRQLNISAKTRFRHYLNLGRMEARLERLLTDFRWGRMDHIFLPGDTDSGRA